MMNNFTIRELNQADLPSVIHIQQSAYPLALWENHALFEHKLILFPPGCLGVVNERILCAYLFCHPWKAKQYIPLNTTTISLPADANSLYLHDIAVHHPFRNCGIARRLITYSITLAESFHFKNITLVAVNNSIEFWAKFGFTSYMCIQYANSIAGMIMNREIEKQ